MFYWINYQLFLFFFFFPVLSTLLFIIFIRPYPKLIYNLKFCYIEHEQFWKISRVFIIIVVIIIIIIIVVIIIIVIIIIILNLIFWNNIFFVLIEIWTFFEILAWPPRLLVRDGSVITVGINSIKLRLRTGGDENWDWKY